MGNKLGGFCTFLAGMAAACAVAAGVLLWAGAQEQGPLPNYGDKLLCLAPSQTEILQI